MKFLLDTHLILWAASSPDDLSQEACQLINDEANELFFSPANLWEIAIKSSLQKENFQVDTRVLRRNLLDNGYYELAITSAHTVFIQSLPSIHKNPFDRILVAQATVEGITLLTADTLVAQYPGPIRQV
ncbi:type II toxin-antitoxin system VapC family toxin [Legionella clemsonensis]|uniref:PIN domain protein n=1 Tax=Legionella clemsonensis TaxID=1867846 RepID=A0A222P4M9_9GAMM|nr:type II toxin-antitoxin system VapC family toxin [Legionella clemsonensis]ASQ46773.1 PIN domain protein [Legionella clemsonensis]